MARVIDRRTGLDPSQRGVSSRDRGRGWHWLLAPCAVLKERCAEHRVPPLRRGRLPARHRFPGSEPDPGFSEEGSRLDPIRPTRGRGRRLRRAQLAGSRASRGCRADRVWYDAGTVAVNLSAVAASAAGEDPEEPDQRATSVKSVPRDGARARPAASFPPGRSLHRRAVRGERTVTTRAAASRTTGSRRAFNARCARRACGRPRRHLPPAPGATAGRG